LYVQSSAAAVPGRVQGGELAVKNELPVSGTERRHTVPAAATATFVGYGGEGHGDVKDAVVKLVGHVLDELVGEDSLAFHA